MQSVNTIDKANCFIVLRMHENVTLKEILLSNDLQCIEREMMKARNGVGVAPKNEVEMN